MSLCKRYLGFLCVLTLLLIGLGGSVPVFADQNEHALGDTGKPADYEQTIGGPDLTLSSSNISFAPESPVEGDQVTISAAIRNIGDEDANNVKVQFFDGDPDNAGTLIGEDRIDFIGTEFVARSGITFVEGFAWIPPSYDVAVYANIDYGFAFANIPDPTVSFSRGGTVHVTDKTNSGCHVYRFSPIWIKSEDKFTWTVTGFSGYEPGIAQVTWDTTGEPGSHDIYVEVDPDNMIAESNEDNNEASKMIEVRPAKWPPTADAGGPYTANEGDTVTLDASGSSDPDDNIVLYEWDLDSDGEYDDATGVTADVVFGDNGSFTVGLRVTDAFGESDTDTAEVAVNNVAPTASFANTSGTVFEGELATLTFSNESDPSTADTAAGFRYSYDCTDDGTFELAGDPAPSFECPYPSAGTFTARGIIEDKDGGSTEYTVVVTVLSPQGAADTVIDDVQDMVDTGTLNQGQGTALISKLDAAIAKLNQGKDKPAINLLRALINQVNDLIDTGVLTAEEGQPLIDTANRIIDSIG